VSFDGAAFSLPDNPPKFKDREGLHWDLSQDILASAAAGTNPLRMQGVLYLNDMPEDGTGGGFHCIPQFQHRFREWAASCPEGKITVPDVFNDAALRDKFPIKRVVANAGDLVIWHSLLPQ
jgi:hypothetical protein